MNIALWVITGFLAVAFLGAGFAKLAATKQQLHDKGMTYVEDFSAGTIKLIGAAEVAGAVGLVAPAFVDGVEWLVPLSAALLALTMVLAVVVHMRRKEAFAPALVLAALSVVVAVGRAWVEKL